MTEHTGWLLDAYSNPEEGDVTVWFLDDGGERRCLRHYFPVTFYAAGPSPQLRALWSYLQSQPVQVRLKRAERRDLFYTGPLTVLEIQVDDASEQPALFRKVEKNFPDLDYYDADLQILTRYTAAFDVFPLVRCRVEIDAEGWIRSISPLESRWSLDLEPPPLRILRIEPDVDPFHAEPSAITVRYDRYHSRIPLKPERPFLASLAAVLRRNDPDLILADWGDTWLLPHLLELSNDQNDLLPLNRDANKAAVRKEPRTYHSYGQIIYRGQQVLLFGRFHIDCQNAMMFDEYGLEGVFELARVSGLPVQVVARNSPGAGITAMQIIEALRMEILVPYHKQQTEGLKSARDLIRLDQGGLVYPPISGLHFDVGEIDFVSMYPSIMRKFNLSPETMDSSRLDAAWIARLDTSESEARPGLIPRTLAPLLEKRIAIKERIAGLNAKDYLYKPYKARSSALKWLLVVSFGYTGYKNAKFGQIEAHQAITAYAREILLAAKETAEAIGFTVLHMYIDGLWVQKPGVNKVEDFQPVLEAIASRTKLPIALDGIFKWVAFLPSRMDKRVAVPNRYFGVFQNSEIKVRGIDARRRDTPKFIAQTQMEALQLLAKAPTADQLPMILPAVIAFIRRRLRDLREGRVSLDQLIVRQKLSRNLEEYIVPSPAALAGLKMEANGKSVRMGQSTRFLFVRGEQKIAAWDAAEEIPYSILDFQRYSELMIRAMSNILQPFGIEEEALWQRVVNNVSYLELPGLAANGLRQQKLAAQQKSPQSRIMVPSISNPFHPDKNPLITPR